MSAPAVSDQLGRRDGRRRASGKPIRGPRALDDSWSRFWHLAYNIARSEFKLKFFGSALGYLWQVMRPLLLFGVLYVFFVKIFHVDKATGAAAHFYGAQLLGSIVLFTFFGEATSGAVRSVVDRENLVRKIQFPRLAIPISVVLLPLFNLGLNLVVVMIFAVASGVRPMLSWLELPLIILMLTRARHRRRDAALGAVREDSATSQPIWEVSQPDPVLLLAGDHPRRNGEGKLICDTSHQHRGASTAVSPRPHQLRVQARWTRSLPLPPLHAQPTGHRLPAVPPRDDQSRDAQRRAGMGSWAALLEPLALVAVDLRARLLGLQSRGPAHRRGSVEHLTKRSARPDASLDTALDTHRCRWDLRAARHVSLCMPHCDARTPAQRV